MREGVPRSEWARDKGNLYCSLPTPTLVPLHNDVHDVGESLAQGHTAGVWQIWPGP